MADKFPSTVNAFINFVAGEQPTAEKFNALVAQTKYGFSGLEAAVGDIHGASWPYLADGGGVSSTRLTMPYFRNVSTGNKMSGSDSGGRSLDIVSLARLVGPASNLNPMIVDSNHTVTNEEKPEAAGKTEFQLRYPISGTVSATNPAFSFDSGGSLTAFKTTSALVQQHGDYHVTSGGTVYCFTAVGTSSLTATYTTDPMTYAGGANHPYARFNVIPDPNQTSSSSSDKVVVTSAGADGLHTVQLPIITHQQTNYLGNSSSLSEPTDLNYGVQAKLPFVLTENFTTGQTIPAGFLYLKNFTTNEVYSDATYIYNDEDTFQVGSVDIESRIAAGDVFQVITVGTDITSAILDLQFKLFTHKHSRSHGEGFVSVTNLSDNYEHSGESGTYMPSTIEGNHFAQYLNRDGYRPNDEDTICNDGNALRGNLVFSKYQGSPGEYVVGDNGVTARGSTYGIGFGGNVGDGYPTTTFGPTITGNQDSITGNITNLHIKTEDSAGAYILNSGQGSFIVNMDSNVSMTANDFVHITSSNDDVLITAQSDAKMISDLGSCYMNSGSNIYLNSDNDIYHISEDDMYFTLNGSTSQARFYFPDWSGGNSGSAQGFHILGDSSSSYLNSLFTVRGQNADGPLCTLDNSSSGGVNNSSKLLWLEYSESNAAAIGGSTSNPGAIFVMFAAKDRNVGKIQCRNSGHSPKDILLKITSSATIKNAGSHSRERSGDVSYISGGSDFGELVLCGNIDEWPELELNETNKCMYIQEGLIVYVREGKFWRNGDGVPMVVTHRAMVIGNSSEDIESEYHTVLSFVGQVPVIVKGKTHNGDYLVPENNYCFPISPDLITFADYKKAIGTAWETSISDLEDDTYRKVLCAVGVK